MRIVSLLPSSTEIIDALGFRGGLVGRSHECDYPAGIEALPILTRPRFNPEGSSREIDMRVKATLRDARSVYELDADRLRRLAPDLIVTQSQCEVCAVSLKDVQQAIRDWTDGGPRVLALEPNRLEDVLADIRRVAQSLEAEERGDALVKHIRERMHSIRRRAASLPHPRVATLEWLDPLMSAGNWVPPLVEMAGGLNLFGEEGRHSPWLGWDELIDADPEVLVILPCGFDMPRTRREMGALIGHPAWSRLRAARDGHVYLTDGRQFFNRPGPRLAESLEILAELLHPTVFSFGHEGTGWKRWTERP